VSRARLSAGARAIVVLRGARKSRSTSCPVSPRRPRREPSRSRSFLPSSSLPPTLLPPFSPPQLYLCLARSLARSRSALSPYNTRKMAALLYSGNQCLPTRALTRTTDGSSAGMTLRGCLYAPPTRSGFTPDDDGQWETARKPPRTVAGRVNGEFGRGNVRQRVLVVYDATPRTVCSRSRVSCWHPCARSPPSTHLIGMRATRWRHVPPRSNAAPQRQVSERAFTYRYRSLPMENND